MKPLLRKLLNIQPGEGRRAALMFAYIFFVIATLTMIKPVRNSLFLSRFGVEQLPFAFLLVAIVSGLVAFGYTRLVQRLPLNRLILNTLAISVLSLLLFWWILAHDFRGIFCYVFYIWVAIFGVIITTQFWLLAGYVFHAREARRLFGLIGAGAISGGIFGGYAANYFAPIIGTHLLMLLAAGFLVGCSFIFKAIWSCAAKNTFQQRERRSSRIEKSLAGSSALKTVLHSRYFMLLAAAAGISVVVANLVDYQFSAVASNVIRDPDRLTAFFGFWMSTLSLTSLAIQLLITSRVLKSFGVGASLLFLPIGLMGGAAALLIAPALWSAVLVKVADGGLKQSINKSGFELLHLPIPRSVRGQVKSFIDVFVDNLATGVSGALLIIFSLVIGLTVGQISFVVLVFIAGWIYLLQHVRREYVNAIRLAIERREINPEEQTVTVKDAAIMRNLIGVLDGDNERQILYVLRLLESAHSPEIGSRLVRLINHPSSEVRAQTLKIALTYDDIDITQQAYKQIHDSDEDVRIVALHYLCERLPEGDRLLDDFINQNETHLQTSALICVAHQSAEHPQLRKTFRLAEKIDTLLRKDDFSRSDEDWEYVRVSAARAIGIACDKNLSATLLTMLKDTSPRVIEAAIISAGKCKEREFIPLLIEHLSMKPLRKQARAALAQYGEESIEFLIQRFDEPSSPYRLRLEILKVFAMIGTQRSVEILASRLTQSDPPLRYETIRALNKLRLQLRELNLSRRFLNEAILREVRGYAQTSLILSRFRAKDASLGATNDSVRVAQRFLVKALEEKLEADLERTFRLLGLRHSAQDMYNAYLGITSNRADLRANAIELLDNVLDARLKPHIIPMVDAKSGNSPGMNVPEAFDRGVPSMHESMTSLLEGEDNWLRVCTLQFVAMSRAQEFLPLAKRLSTNPDPLVRESAEYTRRALEAAA